MSLCIRRELPLPGGCLCSQPQAPSGAQPHSHRGRVMLLSFMGRFTSTKTSPKCTCDPMVLEMWFRAAWPKERAKSLHMESVRSNPVRAHSPACNLLHTGLTARVLHFMAKTSPTDWVEHSSMQTPHGRADTGLAGVHEASHDLLTSLIPGCSTHKGLLCPCWGISCPLLFLLSSVRWERIPSTK